MTEKDYLLLLKKQAQKKRVVCGFNQNDYGQTIVTTGIPKQYKEGQTTYINQKTMSYEAYAMSQILKKVRKRK